MILDDLEQAYRARLAGQGEPVVIVAMQIAESDIRVLRPKLVAKGESLSEHVRTLIRMETGQMPIPMMEVR